MLILATIKLIAYNIYAYKIYAYKMPVREIRRKRHFYKRYAPARDKLKVLAKSFLAEKGRVAYTYILS
jgi:hypothetical protein